MKLIRNLTIASAIVLGAASANAADVYEGGLKDGPVYVPAQTWTGFYVGVNGGYGWSASGSQIDVDGYTQYWWSWPDEGRGKANIGPEGGFGGGQIGYNLQRGHLVFGVEADIQGAGITDKVTAATSTWDGDNVFTATAKSDLDWFGTLRGRVGYSFDRTLIYFTGGFAFGGVKDSLSVTANDWWLGSSTHAVSKDETLTGYVLGGGLEYALNPSWSLKGEYQYINLGTEKLSTGTGVGDWCAFSVAEGSVKVDHEYHTVRVGLNYHFDQGYEPLK